MRSLLIFRHAKSSWDYPNLDDFDRPLNKRGGNDAPEMGARLKKSGYFPDLMISSPAKRAIDTCIAVAEAVGYPKKAIKKDERLYHASSGEILEILKKTDDLWLNVAIFGHNPGLTSFANYLNNTSIYNIPTAGMIMSDLDISSWKNIAFGKGIMRFFDFPKNR
ncbi:SixA phosphatase family protein [Fulvivirga sedimenti]|uniref:Histidine phosphatase family protein n=1 Tax=Fulvivirga sedimenti TaxID=2879465 RepID=A0A9X1HMY4_9BACT|nr:histidine phosphatase family protein [Fulvivirga sedimenti]MCA6073960.1 histidine phosphatase family protein [Fulvivirga sedimenti]